MKQKSDDTRLKFALSAIRVYMYRIYRAFHNVLHDYNYNKKTKRTYLNGIFHSHRKTEKCCCFFFLRQLEMFDVCTTGDTAHIDTVFKLLLHTRQHVDACVAATFISYRCVPCQPWCTHRTSLVV